MEVECPCVACGVDARPRAAKLSTETLHKPEGGSLFPPVRFDMLRCQFMRAVVQRVSEASVSIGGVVKGRIGRGLLVLVGVEDADSADDINWLAGKLARLRVFDDTEGVMNLGAQEVGGEVLVISQFTLFASTKKGNRPSYIRAAKPEVAAPLYNCFLRALGKQFGRPVQCGEFGADMNVALVNDGPVTIVFDTKARE